MLIDYQQQAKRDIYQAWDGGAINVMPVMPTGSGKTVLFCNIVQELNRPACIIAHRQELVGQSCLALARERVEHSIIAPRAVVQSIIALEYETFGYTTYNSRAPIRVAGVDTIIRRDHKDRWFQQVATVVQDEGHHVLASNKWGQAQLAFPNARGIFPTAHAVRPGGEGLGRHAEGLVDRLVVGPYGRQLINRGFLTDYRLVCVPGDVDFSDVPVGPSGELNQVKLRAATHRSKRIVGDVVKHYLKWAPGKLGITFAVDIEAAKDLREAYRAADVPAEIITANTPLAVRAQLMRKFRARKILQLVSVDCLGEGVDVPAIEVVSMARRTASWQLMCQQFGRALRVMVASEHWPSWIGYDDSQRLAAIAVSEKPKAIILDHVGNIIWHANARGLPDSQQTYSLDKVDSRSRSRNSVDSLRPCLSCYLPFERYRTACPYCGAIPTTGRRGSVSEVDGDLAELDANVLAMLRGEVDQAESAPRFPANADTTIRRAVLRRHHERASMQRDLRGAMMLWGGWQIANGLSIRESQKFFYLRFGVDVLTAQAYKAKDAEALRLKIEADLTANNVRGADDA